MDCARADPLARALLSRFPGAEIVEVRQGAGEPMGSDDALPLDLPGVDPDLPDDEPKRGAAMADFLGLMKQATELKSKMEAMQAELDRIEVEGSAGGGLVAVTLSGK